MSSRGFLASCRVSCAGKLSKADLRLDRRAFRVNAGGRIVPAIHTGDELLSFIAQACPASDDLLELAHRPDDTPERHSCRSARQRRSSAARRLAGRSGVADSNRPLSAHIKSRAEQPKAGKMPRGGWRSTGFRPVESGDPTRRPKRPPRFEANRPFQSCQSVAIGATSPCASCHSGGCLARRAD